MIRRSSVLDMVWPDGLGGLLHLHGSVRDELGAGLDEWTALHATVDYLGGRTLTAVALDPPVAGVGALVGAGLGSRYRTALDQALPELAGDGSAAALLLDELSGAGIISGYALALGSTFTTRRRDPDRAIPVGVCAGWVEGGRIATAAIEGEPMIVPGPPAPAIADDPLRLDPLPPNGMRRRRQLELHDDGRIDAMFRDSFMDAGGHESVVHHYRLEGQVDLGTDQVIAMEAVPVVLPAEECFGAVGSASRVVGLPLDQVRAEVRATFSGTSTCTHLNDALRGIGDLAALAATLRSRPGAD